MIIISVKIKVSFETESELSAVLERFEGDRKSVKVIREVPEKRYNRAYITIKSMGTNTEKAR